MSERKSKNIVIIALCITLIFMGVGFAALSQTLTINGSATVSGEWEVQIKQGEADMDGIALVEAKIEGDMLDSSSDVFRTLDTAANVTGTTTATFNVELNEPGDYAIYRLDFVNEGNIDATLRSIAETSSAPDLNHVILYELGTYESGQFTAVAADTLYGTDLLASGQNTFYVRVSFDNVDELPKEENLSTRTYTYTFDYAQK